MELPFLVLSVFRLHLEHYVSFWAPRWKVNVNLETVWGLEIGQGSGIRVVWKDSCLVKRVLGMAGLT